MEPTLGSFLSLVGSLGSATAAVVVVYLFLGYLKAQRAEVDQRYADLVRSLDERK
jgi:predicted PurR-regulated permease PerM